MRGIFYIVLLMIITGCGLSNSHPRALDYAENLMQNDPLAALTTLNGIDVSEFRDSATMARWALLYCEALVANHLSAPTDTIVNIAIDYYGGHNHTDELQKASRLKALIKASETNDELATALYLKKEKEFMLYKERARREQFMLVSLFILFIAAGTIMWMRQRIKMHALRNNALIAEASGLKTQIDMNRGDIGRLEMKLHGMLEDRFTLIDSLCQTYYESQGTNIERKAIVDKVKSEIDSLRNDYSPVMEKAVNDCRDNILIKVKENYPEIKPEEYQLLVYLASGLSSRTISLLLGETVEIIYKRKSRLKARLKKTVASSHPEILSVF